TTLDSSGFLNYVAVEIDNGATDGAMLSDVLRGMNQLIDLGNIDVVILPYVTESEYAVNALLKHATSTVVNRGGLVLVPTLDDKKKIRSPLISPCNLAVNKLGMLCVATTFVDEPTKLYSSAYHSGFAMIALPGSSVSTRGCVGNHWPAVNFKGSGASLALLGGIAA
ncbi:hypothetical protein FOL47_006051, partial [Perkinsus chesapeaki]